MKARRFSAILAVAFALACLAVGSAARAQTVPDDPTVQGGTSVYQAPGAGLPFGRGGLPVPFAGTPTPPAPAPPQVATPAPSDSTASASPFNPAQPFATAQCQDGWFSFSQTRSGTCSGHGGVMVWIVQPGDLDALINQRAQEAAVTASDQAAAFIPAFSSSSSATGTSTAPAYQGNGQGPTLCNDNTVSPSAGQGTCSGHGGEAPH